MVVTMNKPGQSGQGVQCISYSVMNIENDSEEKGNTLTTLDNPPDMTPPPGKESFFRSSSGG